MPHGSRGACSASARPAGGRRGRTRAPCPAGRSGLGILAFEPVRGEPARQLLEAFVVTADNRVVAMDPDDPRRSLEGAEHEHDPAVLTEMGDRLDTAAGPVEVGDAMQVDDRELTVVALR